MQTYLWKRYRRSAPGRDSGIATDEVRFTASSVQEAEMHVRRMQQSSPGPMDWEKYFATLEDEDGHVMVTWLHSWWHG
jgi:hypothetical protein